jgi:hypothetical protein
MSEHEPTADERHDEVTYMDDVVPRQLVLRVLSCAVVISVVLCVIAYLLLGFHERALRPGRHFPERDLPAPHVVANVRAAPFELPDTTPSLNDDERVLLHSWGWADERKRVVRIPVERAMELLLERSQGEQP